ncbi:MAG: hypothetical protein IPI62_16110 [Bacteroidetes bacterium]|nr:hypothetical protein [Bacteroidota bacterium]
MKFIIRVIVSIVLLGLLAVSFHLLISGLIINSQISFDVNTPLEMSEFSIWAYAAISLMLITFLYAVAIMLRLLLG